MCFHPKKVPILACTLYANFFASCPPWPNQKWRIMICFSLLWVGLIWITDVKIPQDVLKMISGHVVAKKWCVKNVVSIPILFKRIFLENPHNNKMSYKYLHLIWTCIFPIIQSCTRILVNTLTQQFNRIFVPIVICLSKFCMNIFISISLSIVHILSSKNSSKTAPRVNSFKSL